jgi:hypothetical protein
MAGLANLLQKGRAPLTLHILHTTAPRKTRCEAVTRYFPYWLGCAPELVNQYAEDLVTSDWGVAGNDSGGIVSGWMLAQVLVWPVVIETADVLSKNTVGVACVVNQHPVGAFGGDAADEPSRVVIRPGRAGRNLDDVNAFGSKDGIESSRELRVRSRMRKREKVGGQQSAGLGAQEGPPPGVATPGGGPSRAAARIRRIVLAPAHAVPQSGQFSLEASVSPGRIVPCQAQHLWGSKSRLALVTCVIGCSRTRSLVHLSPAPAPAITRSAQPFDSGEVPWGYLEGYPCRLGWLFSEEWSEEVADVGDQALGLFDHGEMAARIVLAPQADVGIFRGAPPRYRLGQLVRKQGDAGGHGHLEPAGGGVARRLSVQARGRRCGVGEPVGRDGISLFWPSRVAGRPGLGRVIQCPRSGGGRRSNDLVPGGESGAHLVSVLGCGESVAAGPEVR